MSDLIERQAAIDAVKGYWKAEVDAIPKDADFGTVTATCDLILKCNTEMCKVLDGIPSAQPEIIRCKDCKHRHTGDCPMYHVEWVEYDDDGYIEMDDIEYDNTEDDGFCYRGVRDGSDR